jgi:hypothetical protein
MPPTLIYLLGTVTLGTGVHFASLLPGGAVAAAFVMYFMGVFAGRLIWGK